MVLRVSLFSLAVCMGIVGCLMALDAFIPKEKSVETWFLVLEFIAGATVLASGIFIARRNRLARKPDERVKPCRPVTDNAGHRQQK